MAQDAIEAGSTVQVKSGSPQMTVKSLQGTDAICVWFEGGKKKEAKFALVTLVHDNAETRAKAYKELSRRSAATKRRRI